MVKIVNNTAIIDLSEKERNKIKEKVESICSDIERVSNKFHRLKDGSGENPHNLSLINSNILNFESFRKDLMSIWGKHLKEKIKENPMITTMETPMRTNQLEKRTSSSDFIIKDKTDLVIDTVEKLEGTYGKLVPLKSVSKILSDRMTTKEVSETIKRLVKTGDIFQPKKEFLLRM